jgi:glutathione S-transferase
MPSLPLLYSFRRCPYAIRARLAIAISGVQVEMQEVDLKYKPERMLLLSPKGTVPVLELPGGQVIDESMDIMLWALGQRDPFAMLDAFSDQTRALIQRNDIEFKQALDRYKYPERYPEFSRLYYRSQCETFLSDLNFRLEAKPCLFSDKPGIGDLALLPFIRQFAQVDREGFDAGPYAAVRRWLDAWVASELFTAVMKKN